MTRSCLYASLFVLLTVCGATAQDEFLTSPSDRQVAVQAEQPSIPAPRPQRLEMILGTNYPDRPFESIDVITETDGGLLPTDLSANVFQPPGSEPQAYAPLLPFMWVAPEIWHKSLYFDDVQLERYGQTRAPRLQPLLSGAHFFGTLSIMPYKMGLNHPFEMTSNLGYYRPGSPTPCVGRRLPWEWDAALMQAGAWVGGVFIFP